MLTNTSNDTQKKIDKLLITASCFGFLTLTGCQTTTGVPHPQSNKTTNYPTIYQADSQTINEGSHQSTQHQSTQYQSTKVIQNKNKPLQQPSNDTIQEQPSDYTNPSQPDLSSPTPESSSKTNSKKYDQQQPVIPSISENKPSSDKPNSIYIIKPPENDAKTARQILLEQARQNSQQKTISSRAIQNGDNIPAFRKLMNTGVRQLRQGQLSSAQSTFTRAQRLAPQSSAVYFYLGQVALKQNQALKAEAMARRGLVVAQSTSRKKALWQLVLKSAQMQGNQRVINEARAALSK